MHSRSKETIDELKCTKRKDSLSNSSAGNSKECSDVREWMVRYSLWNIGNDASGKNDPIPEGKSSEHKSCTPKKVLRQEPPVGVQPVDTICGDEVLNSSKPETVKKLSETSVVESLIAFSRKKTELEFGEILPKFLPQQKKCRKYHRRASSSTVYLKNSIIRSSKTSISQEMDDYLKEDKRIGNLKGSDPTLERLVFACNIQQVSNWCVELCWKAIPNSRGNLYIFLTDRFPRVRVLLTRDHQIISETFMSFSLCSPTRFAAHEQHLHINFDRLDIVSIMFPSKGACGAFLELIVTIKETHLESALIDSDVRHDREEALICQGLEMMKHSRVDYSICYNNEGIVTNAVEDRDLNHNRIMAKNRVFSLFSSNRSAHQPD